MKRSTSLYVDGELIEEAKRKGINISQTLNDSLKKTLKRDLSLKEIEEMITIKMTEIEELQNKSDILIEEMRRIRKLEFIAKSKEESDYEQQKQLNLVKLKEKLDNIPEIQQIDISLISNTKYLFEIVTKLRSSYPDLNISIMDLRTYLLTKQSHT